MPDLNVCDEYTGLYLGDRRLERRALHISKAIGQHPGRGFPSVFETEADLEGFYRFVNNAAVSPDALMAPHSEQSFARASVGGGAVLVLHDTSEFRYGGESERVGLARRGNRQSFHGHFALGVPQGDAPVVYGVLGCRNYVVEDGTWREAVEGEELVDLLVGSDRWSDLAAEIRLNAPAEMTLVHVMDREADDYELWTYIIEQGDDFVIRAQHNRRLANGAQKMFDSLAEEPLVLQREVMLSRRSKHRPPGSKRTHPPRERRPARLALRYGQVEVRRPAGVAPFGQATMTVSVVEVVEVNPPVDAEPIHWLILSTLPVDTAEEASRIVDIYRKRWLIEEYFKALKTGCAAEKRQARSLWSLLNTIALLIPLAWRLLLLRSLSRHDPKAPASRVVDPLELRVLRTMAKGVKLPRSPTCRQVTLAIARVGGHLRSNGEPGWLVLGRGMERLLDTTIGWRAAIKFMDEGGEMEM